MYDPSASCDLWSRWTCAIFLLDPSSFPCPPPLGSFHRPMFLLPRCPRGQANTAPSAQRKKKIPLSGILLRGRPKYVLARTRMSSSSVQLCMVNVCPGLSYKRRPLFDHKELGIQIGSNYENEVNYSKQEPKNSGAQRQQELLFCQRTER